MKLKKPTGNTGKTTFALLGGVVMGVIASRVGMGFIDDPASNPDVNKAKQATTVKRIVVGGAGGILAASVDGNDTLAAIAKGMGVGIAADSSLALIKFGAERGGVADEATATTTGKKALARAVGLSGTDGLGCPCNNTGLGRRRRNRKGLGAPDYAPPAYTYSAMDRGLPSASLGTPAIEGWGSLSAPSLESWAVPA